jgi:hypothetical protein
MMRAVSPSYFAALRLRTIAGRRLDETDTPTSRPVVVVNRTFASRYLGPESLGTKLALNLGKHRDWEVVGVVDDMRQGGMIGRPPAPFGGIAEPPLPEFFFAASQWPVPVSELILVVRTTGDPVSLTPTLAAVVRQEDPTLALDSVMTMDERVMESLARPRIYAVLLGAFALCALTIAMVGCSNLSHMTARRTEIGIRRRLARPRDVASPSSDRHWPYPSPAPQRDRACLRRRPSGHDVCTASLRPTCSARRFRPLVVASSWLA